MLTYIAFYKLLFTVELSVAEFLFTFRLKKRSYYPLRFAAVVIALMGVAAIPIPMNAFWSTSLVFMAMFGLSVLGLWFCYDESFANVFFCAMASYTVQHFAYELSCLFLALLEIGTSPMRGMYSNEPMDFSKFDRSTVLAATLYLMCYLMSYWLLFLLFGRKIKKDTDMKIKSMVLLGLIAAGLLADIVISSVVTYYVTDHFIGAVIAYITNMLCCVLLLGCQFNQLSTNVIQGELDFVRRLWQQEKEQYEVSRDNIDLINIKCHDMRHKIRSITENTLSAEEIAEIENSISIYDSAVKTGNAALDVILTEKSLRCHGNDISFTCVADGSLLNFMSESDIYSLFGNVMDNAIEATVKIPERDGRTIGLKIKQIGNFVSVNAKNTFDGNLELDKRGLPITTKSDKNYHGFGIKSVSYLAEKYGGNLSVAADDGVFDLNLLFPIVQADKTE